ncbi:hypothetical protein F5883DRAFT_928 [Diaporthe sp. PMI_573]|nr:hypothetical protein F5883DRAFT_928 [Diaporthaceae sp. PMI_573]
MQSHSRYINSCRPERSGWHQAVGVSDEGAARSTWPPFPFRRETVLSSDGIEATKDMDELCPFKVGDRGVPNHGDMRLGVLCAISLDILGHTPPQPLSIFSPRRQASRGFRNGCFVPDFPGRLSVVFCVSQLGLARCTAVVSSGLGPRTPGQSLPDVTRCTPRGRVGILSHSPISPTKSIVCEGNYFTWIHMERLTSICRLLSRPGRATVKEAVGGG